MRVRAMLLAIPLVLLIGACCGGSSGNGTPTGSPEPVTVQITAHGRAFDRQTITVAAGAHVTIELINLDADPHNVAVYNDRAAEQQLFVGDTILGPNTTTKGSFDAPTTPGTYFFRCDVHPVTMTGEFVVQ